ncbi:SDR family NAD(P)-dependent oxidoreductase [Novosphingobium sp. TH158]|uniref:SDR family NAD(P)-dependent oxidoreductase n=1 Tax=Novosphingobium sp. TH158 TaxID=2067455 RepID=UPI000C7CB82E|nr:SDR family oxidoreductase [Novosphingobium sp. TH158]PLK26634.1 NAD(P)-dependent oxidoreductase [Novosphingobium sp. TH158]
MSKRYDGKTVVVTGAAGGLGRALALGYAREGGELVILDIQAEGLEETAGMVRALGAKCTTFQIDLSKEEQIESVGAAILAQFPKIDVLYNNAGIAYGEVNTPIDRIPLDRFQFFLMVNTLSPLYFARVLRPALKEAKGCVINQSSMAAYQPAGVYGVTKATLNQLTWGMARMFGADGIRVVAVAPGLMETEASASSLGAEKHEEIRRLQMLSEKGSPEDIVNLGLFLGSEDARFITAEVMHCDAGHPFRAWRD